MRIIAGTKKGMKLFEPEGDVSRPILDRVKGSLFSSLYSRGLLEGAVVADLFAGVGSLGLEALSRGAAWVTFIEIDVGVSAVLKRNIEKSGFVGKSRVIRASTFQVGAMAEQGQPAFNLVFVDPPYAATEDIGPSSAFMGLMRILANQVAPDVLVVVRTQRRTALPDEYGSFSVIDRREYGKMALTFLGKKTT